MGWDCITREPGERTQDIFARSFRSAGMEIVAFRMVGNTAYMAIRNPDGETWGCTALTKWERTSYSNWSYLLLCETDGHGEDDCPAVVLDALTETTNRYALAWRARCRKRLAQPKVTPGATVTFSEPVSFLNGYKARTFYVESLQPSSWRAMDGTGAGTRVKIPPSFLKRVSFEVGEATPMMQAIENADIKCSLAVAKNIEEQGFFQFFAPNGRPITALDIMPGQEGYKMVDVRGDAFRVLYDKASDTVILNKEA